MTQPLFPSKIGTQSRCTKSLTMKTVVRKPQKNEGQIQTYVLCGCTTFGTELKLGTKLYTVPTPTVAWTRTWLLQGGGGGR